MRVVLDTNIFVSLLIRPGTTLRALSQILDRETTILYSVDSLSELLTVLRRGKFAPFITLDHIVELSRWIIQTGELVERIPPLTRSRDADDDKFLSIAVAGHADYLITGDKDLLVIGRVGETEIVTPARFISLAQT